MSLLPSRLSLSCSRAITRVCRCTTATTPIRSKTSKRKKAEPIVPLPKPSTGSPSAQPILSYHSTHQVLEKIKAESQSDDILSILRQASVNNLATTEVYREVFYKLCKQDNVDDALKILKSSKSADILSHFMVLCACTIAKREKDVKALVDEIGKHHGGNFMSFDSLLQYAGVKEDAEVEGKKENKKEATKQKETTTKAFEAMLVGYLALEDTTSATELLYKMEDKEIVTDLHYARVLNALGTKGLLSDAESLMSRMTEKRIPVVHSSTCAQLIWILCSSGKVDDAFTLYEHTRSRGLSLEELAPRALEVLAQYRLDEAVKLVKRDGERAGADAYAPVVQALMSNGQQERAIELLQDIYTKHIPLTQNIVLVALKLLSRAGHMQAALGWVENLEKQGERPSEEVQAQVLSTYFYHGRINAAQKKLTLLRASGELNATLYNVLIQGYVYRGQVEEAWKQLDRMKQDGIRPNAQTFAYLAQSADIGCLKKAEEAIWKAKEFGIEPTAEMYMSLVSGEAASGNFARSWLIMAELEKSSGLSSPILLKAYNNILHSMVTHFKPVVECEDVCKRMLSRNVFPDAGTYEALILSHINEGTLTTAFGLFEKLKELQLVPTLRTIKNLHSACFNSSNMDWYNAHVA